MILKIIKILNWDAKSFLYLPDAASASLLNALITTQIIKNFHILELHLYSKIQLILAEKIRNER